MHNTNNSTISNYHPRTCTIQHFTSTMQRLRYARTPVWHYEALYKFTFFISPTDTFFRDGRISDPAIWIRPDFHYPVKSTPVGLHVSQRIRSALMCQHQSNSLQTLVVEVHLSVSFDACVEWLTTYSDRPRLQVHLLRPCHPPPASPATHQSIPHTVFLPNVCFLQTVT